MFCTRTVSTSHTRNNQVNILVWQEDELLEIRKDWKE